MIEMNGHNRVLKFLDFDIRGEFEGQTEENNVIEDKGNAVGQENNNANEQEETNDGQEIR